MARPLRIDYEALEAELCRRSLPDFIAKAWPLVEPDKPLVWNWHLDALCEVLAAVSRGELKRVVINVPPATSKSLVCSVFWPAWEWASNPGLRYLTASYSQHLTIRDNLRLRSVVTSPWYQHHYRLQLSGDQNSKIRFDTAAQGWRIASSVGGAGTGEHPDRLIIDDPLTADQARSDLERQGANDWYDRTMTTRGVTRDAAVVVVMQRLHMEDLSGHLLGKGGWEHVCFPMRYEPHRAPTATDPGHAPDPRDERTETGEELLWPALFDEQKVRQLELDLGPFGAAGQLQQRPAPEGGGLFKREKVTFVRATPARARQRCRGWDTAATEGAGDWTVGARLALVDDDGDDAGVYVEDVVRGQLGPAGVDSLMLQTAITDGHDCMQREEREGGGAGKSVVAARRKLLLGYDYEEVIVTGAKVTRAGPFRSQWDGGRVYIVVPDPDNPPEWLAPYLHVMEAFPVGKNDDDVDATSTAFNALVIGRQEIHLGRAAPSPDKPSLEERRRERIERRAGRAAGRAGGGILHARGR